MKLVTIAFTAIAAFSFTGLYAQTGTTITENTVEHETEAAWRKELGLSEAQVGSV